MSQSRNILLVLGDQLNHDSLLWKHADKQRDRVLMIETAAESTAPLSSKLRTAVFLSAMRHFAHELTAKDYSVEYILLSQNCPSLAQGLIDAVKKFEPDRILAVLAGDFRVKVDLDDAAEQCGTPIQWLQDNHFIANPGEFKEWVKPLSQPRMEYWYRRLRKRTGVLMNGDEPTGGTWNLDKLNRKAFGKEGPNHLVALPEFRTGSISQAVIEDIQTYLPNLYGNLDTLHYPVNRRGALRMLDHFIEHHLPFFGDHQDAMWTHEPFLHHSLLAMSLNLKLLSPKEVIDRAAEAYQKETAPLNAVEGFIRQILGWREYIRGMYWTHRHHWDSMNHLNARRKLPEFYWTADTHMQCLHHSVKQVLDRGYGHHIQRLMVTGLFALLYGVKPKEIDEWYLAMYVDAVRWVQAPNTLGMSQYADGGLIGSKPYIASGAYIHKMSNYCEHCRYHPKKAHEDNACPFTTLYWAFIDRHPSLIEDNPRLAMQANHWQRKPKPEQEAILNRSEWLHRNIHSL